MADVPIIQYDGKILPRDKKAPQIQVIDPTVHYNGSTLPDDKQAPILFSDPFNTPGVILLSNGVQQIALPPDTVIVMGGEKIIVKTMILDGVPVFERVAREAYELDFAGVIRMQDINGTRYNNTTPPAGIQGNINNVFPQDYLNDIMNYIFIPDTILSVKNSYLNGLGIQQLIVHKFSPTPDRGTKNIGYNLKCFENVVGQSLIIT